MLARRLTLGTMVIVAALCLLWSNNRSIAAGTHRPSQQIIADLNATLQSIPRYKLETQFDPRAGRQMSKEVGPQLKNFVTLLDELDQADHARATNLRGDKWSCLVRLALWQDADALKSLNDLAASTNPDDALLGKVGLISIDWFRSPESEEAAQRDLIARFAALAKASPKDDMLVGAALTMARYHPASDAVRNDIFAVLDHDLTGPAALRYQHQPYKINRPFKIAIRCLDGKTVNTADWKGKVVLIDFWATWCPPCVAALPNLTRLYQDNHAKGLEILGVSNDSELPALKEFLASHKEMAWPESFGPGGRNGWHTLSPQMGITAIPTAFLIDRNGNLRDMQTGYLDEKLVEQLLEETAKPQTPTAATPAAATPAAAAPAQPATPTAAPATVSAPPAASTPPAAAAPAAPRAPDEATEKQAAAMLDLANSYVSIKRPDRAAEKLNQLIAKYPNTKAAAKAKEMLPELTDKK